MQAMCGGLRRLCAGWGESENKAKLSPAGAGTWDELGMIHTPFGWLGSSVEPCLKFLCVVWRRRMRRTNNMPANNVVTKTCFEVEFGCDNCLNY